MSDTFIRVELHYCTGPVGNQKDWIATGPVAIMFIALAWLQIASLDWKGGQPEMGLRMNYLKPQGGKGSGLHLEYFLGLGDISFLNSYTPIRFIPCGISVIIMWHHAIATYCMHVKVVTWSVAMPITWHAASSGPGCHSTVAYIATPGSSYQGLGPGIGTTTKLCYANSKTSIIDAHTNYLVIVLVDLWL